MAASWLETGLAAIRLAILFTIGLFLPTIIQFLLLFIAGWALDGLVALVSRPLYYLMNLVGTPIHEFSHAIAGWLTLNQVVAIKPLLEPSQAAFVRFKKNLNFPGRVAGSLAPLFGGTLVLWLTAQYVIPGFSVPTIEPPQLDLESAASLGTVLQASMDYVARFLQAAYQNLPSLEWGNWRTWIGLYVALSVGVGIVSSPQDRKILLTAVPLAILLTLAFFALVYLLGDAETLFLTMKEILVPPLLKLSTAVTYAFVLTSVGVLVFLPLRFLGWLLER